MSLEQVWERSNERERGRGEKPVELCGREEEREQGRSRKSGKEEEEEWILGLSQFSFGGFLEGTRAERGRESPKS